MGDGDQHKWLCKCKKKKKGKKEVIEDSESVFTHENGKKGKEGEEDEGEVKSKGRFSTLPTM